MAQNKLNIALVGLGTVGSGVYKILTAHKEDFESRLGLSLVPTVFLEKDLSRADSLGISRDLVVSDFEAIAADPQIDVVVEVMGGVEPARSFIRRSIEAGKSVVTANKELMAKHGEEILRAASTAGVDVYFEASVGGGIPIIRPLRQCLAGNRIIKIMGIVNGTTNFILTRMSEAGESFEDALKEAQSLGYAERDPTADVEGYDAASKIAILASMAFNCRVTFDDVYKEGISRVNPRDIAYANEMGYALKLIALAKEEDSGVDIRVHPMMIPKAHPLAAVSGVFNAIFVEGDAVGEVMFFGEGAGSMPAGSAIVGDIIDIARNLKYGGSGRLRVLNYQDKAIKKIGEVNSSYYLLMEAADRPGVLARIARAFGDHEVSIASVIQKGPRGKSAELVFITHLVREDNLRRALKVIEELEVVTQVRSVIRVEAEE
jgi:homoserine dehydrogenase